MFVVLGTDLKSINTMDIEDMRLIKIIKNEA